ncbi:MAG: HigA family addiction module antitoxin [Pyrinomonadaceae bacterium]
MNRKHRKSNHPGDILRRMYMEPLKLTVSALAESLGVSRKTVSKIANERGAITADMALRLSRAFDTTPELWLNLQQKHDISVAITASGDWMKVEKIVA